MIVFHNLAVMAATVALGCCSTYLLCAAVDAAFEGRRRDGLANFASAVLAIAIATALVTTS